MQHGYNAGQPFFLWLSYEKPHLPFNPPREYASLYDPSEIPLPVGWGGLVEGNAPHKWEDSQKHWRTGIPTDRMTDSDVQRTIAHYYASVSLLDTNIGRLVRHLEEQGLAQRTIIIVSSDHGEMLGQHRLMNKGPYPYDALTRVPFILYDPRRSDGGRVETRLVGQEDLVATLLHAAGLEPPEHMKGRNLLTAIEEAGDIVDGVSGHHYGPHYNVAVRTWRTQRHRYTLYHYQDGSVFEEFYDLDTEPAETTNQATDPAYRSTLSELKQQLLLDIARRDHDRRQIAEIRTRFTNVEDRMVTKAWVTP